jgi:hypothetical protein
MREGGGDTIFQQSQILHDRVGGPSTLDPNRDTWRHSASLALGNGQLTPSTPSLAPQACFAKATSQHPTPRREPSQAAPSFFALRAPHPPTLRAVSVIP